MIDVEQESEALRERSQQLTELLDAGHPVVEGCADVLAESKRLGKVAYQARREAAARMAAGLPVDCVVGNPPPIRRVATNRRGKDLDQFGGRSVVTDELVAYWTHRRDIVAGAVEAVYRSAAEHTPYREALVAACRGHIGVLQQRFAVKSEGGVELESALERYDSAYRNLRESANDAQRIAVEATDRLAALAREKASALLGTDETKGFVANVLGAVLDAPVDPDTAMPLIQVDKTGQPV
jgi:hypothetical protein